MEPLGQNARGFLLARRCADESPLLAIADIGPCTAPSALRCKADITLAACRAFAVGIGGKADMGLCAAHVCFWGVKRAPRRRKKAINFEAQQAEYPRS
jgi:hypothetical protein